MHYRARDTKAVSAWIADSRGAYTHEGQTVCAGFFRYKGFVGCPAWAAGKPCDYCFLETTLRRDKELLEGVAWVDSPDWKTAWPSGVQRARQAVAKWLQDGRTCTTCSRYRACDRRNPHLVGNAWTQCQDRYIPMLLNAGELADSLGFSPEENPHVAMLLDVFSSRVTNPHGHKILLVTKAGLEQTQAHLEAREPSENVILSWSVGNKEWAEPYWPPATRRMDAARWARERGWRVRLRMDPLGHGPVAPYRWALFRAQEMKGAWPEVVTLGNARHRGGRQLLPAANRVALYKPAIAGWRESGYTGQIAVCKETPDMIRKILGIEPEEMRCNCLP